MWCRPHSVADYRHGVSGVNGPSSDAAGCSAHTALPQCTPRQTGLVSHPVPASFVRSHTRPAHPSLVPEVTLHVADDVVALWEAMEDERGRQADSPPFWAAAWPGGQVLARYVLDAPGVVAGRRVLDLGSGSGLVAIAAALAGAAAVVASEIDEFGTTAIPLNAELNGAAGIGVAGALLAGPPPDVDVVLAGDICYDREMT